MEKNIKILVVEDSPTQVLKIKLLLEEEGYFVVTANDGVEAMDYLNSDKPLPNLILSDIVMPNMDGFEFCAKIKKDYGNIPVIILTAYKDEHKLFQDKTTDAADFLFKPVQTEILLSKVRLFINLYNEQQKALNLVVDLKSAKNELETKNLQLDYIAKHDALTTLSNRYSFEKQIRKTLVAAERHKRKFALLIIDINNFKWINDTFGHACGDLILKNLAQTLKEIIREEDHVARIGGDEFAIILNEIESDINAGIVAEKLIDFYKSTPVTLKDKLIDIAVSIGISCYPSFAVTTDDLFKQADLAMYKAKTEGQNCYKFFLKEMNTYVERRNSVKKEIANALQKKEFFLNYQPIVNIKENKIVGIEALLRWKNPVLGNINPAEFISIAEEKPVLIKKIGLWVIEETCRQIVKLKEIGFKKLFFSINLSTIQLEEINFNTDLQNILSRYDTVPVKIDLELAEKELASYILKSSDVKRFLFLKQANLRLSIDDFGTGFSSLNKLTELPLTTLKIDGSFIKKLNIDKKSQAMIKNIIALSKSLNLSCIAECVETKEQVDFLLKNGCITAQGFFFHKPMTADKITELLIREEKQKADNY